jgi:hypothetical protein
MAARGRTDLLADRTRRIIISSGCQDAQTRVIAAALKLQVHQDGSLACDPFFGDGRVRRVPHVTPALAIALNRAKTALGEGLWFNRAISDLVRAARTGSRLSACGVSPHPVP